MLSVFEVYFDSTTDPDSILSDEVKADTKAKVMSPGEARKFGLSGFRDDPGKGVLRLIAVDSKDQGFIQRILERSGGVLGYDVQHVEI